MTRGGAGRRSRGVVGDNAVAEPAVLRRSSRITKSVSSATPIKHGNPNKRQSLGVPSVTRRTTTLGATDALTSEVIPEVPHENEALATKPANQRVTRSSKRMMQSGSSTIPILQARPNKRSIAAKKLAKRVSSGSPSNKHVLIRRSIATDALTYEALSKVPPKIKLPNSPVGCLSCSVPHGEGEKRGERISPEFGSQTENQDIHPMNLHIFMSEEPNAAVNTSLTEIAHVCTGNSVDEEVDSSSQGLVAVESYKVSPEIAPLLERIFTKHGDIAKDCDLCSPANITLFLGLVCSVIQTLQRSTIRKITSEELLRMLNVIQDLESLKFNVGWLHKKVSEIMDMKELVNGYSTLEEEKAKIDEEEKFLVALQQKLKARKDKFEEEYQKLQKMACKIRDAYEKELVDGLL